MHVIGHRGGSACIVHGRSRRSTACTAHAWILTSCHAACTAMRLQTFQACPAVLLLAWLLQPVRPKMELELPYKLYKLVRISMCSNLQFDRACLP